MTSILFKLQRSVFQNSCYFGSEFICLEYNLNEHIYLSENSCRSYAASCSFLQYCRRDDNVEMNMK